jgi:hypothetical protein
MTSVNLQDALADIFTKDLLYYRVEDDWYAGQQGDTVADVMGVISKIKKAFQSAGYIHRDIANEYKNAIHESNKLIKSTQEKANPSDYEIINPDDVHVHVCSCGQNATTRFMTGQEWYEKLEKELGDTLKWINMHDVGLEQEIMLAAKRAAGIE